MAPSPLLLQRVSEQASPELQQDIDLALQHERLEAVASAAAARSVGSMAFLLLMVIAWEVTRSDKWAVYLLPLTLYAVLSALVYAFRRHPFVQHVGWVIVLFDIWVVAAVQMRTLPLSPFPSGVAGFALGIFALLIVLNAVTLSGPIIYLAAGASILAEWSLMFAAGVDAVAMAAAAGVLLLEARVLHVLATRLKAIMAGLGAADVARQMERRKVEEIEAARRTIETMLLDARGQNDRLRQLQEDKDRLTQLLVHDLRSPLAVMTGLVDLSHRRLEKQAGPEKIIHDLEKARETGFRLSGMIGDILGIAKLEDGELDLQIKRLAVRPLLEKVARELRPLLAGKDVRVEVEAPGEVLLEADENLLRRVLENLTANATRYTPDGEVIRLTARREESWVVMAVHNRGAAVDPELRERLFKKYQQARSERGGSGLGLYFCRLAVEAHGGSIALEDVPEWTTSMVMRMPVESAAPQRSQRSSSTQHGQ